MKNNRLFSYAYIIITYALALLVAILLVRYLTMQLWLAILIADVAATVLVFVASLVVGNASVYDPYWSVAPAFVAVGVLAVLGELNFITIATLIVVMLWSVRLTGNWAYTFKNLAHQDWRYTMLKEKSGKLYIAVEFFGIMLFPTLVVYCCMLPMIRLLLLNEFSYLSLIGLVIALVGVALELVADLQVHAFRRNHERKEIIRTGLWKYSRHPNYLGEITFWWGIYFACLASSLTHWYLFFGAAINTLMFLFISIPMAEKRMESYKADFADYKQQTNMLLPFKR